jgi:DNA-binding transcriptional MerR regulator
MDGILSRDETAKRLGVHPHTLDNWHKRGEGPARRTRSPFGRGVFYREEDIEQFEREQGITGINREE